jgi:hypothetical protein
MIWFNIIMKEMHPSYGNPLKTDLAEVNILICILIWMTFCSVDGLETLVTPFSKEEIDAIVNDLPSGKSPGPNGFNIDFLKKCWSNIANDFYEMCFWLL